MTIFTVLEKRNSEEPDLFGEERLEVIPAIGDRILLHWTDGESAYEVNVTKVDINNSILIVEREQ